MVKRSGRAPLTMTEVAYPVPVAGGRTGVNDQCMTGWQIEGRKGLNRMVPGSNDYDPTTTYGGSLDLSRAVIAAAYFYGLGLVRNGSGDKWSAELQLSLWERDKEAFYKILDPVVDAAREYGLQVVFTCLGYSDDAYYETRAAVFDPNSPEFDRAARFVADVAKHYGGHAGMYCVEAFNECDGDHYAFNYWLKKFPIYEQRLAAYCDWLTKFMNLVKHYAGPVRAKLGNGHALIGAMFNAKTYHYDQALKKWVVDVWDFQRNNKDYLTAPNAMLEVPSIHDYWFGAPFADVVKDFLKPFADWCKANGKVGFVGEHGDLRTGAAYYVKGLEDAIKALGLDSAAMRYAPRANYPFPSASAYPAPPVAVPPVSGEVPPPTTPPSSDPATPDPAAVAAAAFTAKLNAGLKAYRTVSLKAGTYTVKGDIIVPSGKVLKGAGPGTVLDAPGGANLVLEDGASVIGVRILGIALKTSGGYPDAMGIDEAVANTGRVTLKASVWRR